MHIRLRRFRLTKAVPLAISRGSSSGSEHLLVTVEHGGLCGRGETGGLDTGHRHYDTDAIATELAPLAVWAAQAEPADPLHLLTALGSPVAGQNPVATQELAAMEALLDHLSPPARCGLDLAVHDWWGRQQGQPLHRLWGLAPGACVATSVTLGLGSTEAVLARLERWWLQLPATRIKLKLGSPDGLDHDRALVQAVSARLQAQPWPCELQVDANGGWSLPQAQQMAPWLAAQGVVLLEQPLAPLGNADADTAGFAALRPHCPLPLVADESCWNQADLQRLAPHVDGINIKLLKCGGLGPALRMARAADALGLKVMVGCYGDSSLLNGAAAQLLALTDWPDLDSHLNLIDDPFVGLRRNGDQLLVPQGPGLGHELAAPQSMAACDSTGQIETSREPSP